MALVWSRLTADTNIPAVSENRMAFTTAKAIRAYSPGVTPPSNTGMPREGNTATSP